MACHVVAHGSLSAAARRDAERAFAEGTDCAIVATSALELGIDVGDLDHVLQFNSPSSVAMIVEGRFREDLYMRIAEKTVCLPPLRERREEIPHLVALSLAGTALRPTAQVVEACMLQPWPGNVRDLMRALTEAKLNAEGESVLSVAHLPAWARRGAAVPAVVQEEAPRHLSRADDDNAPSKRELRETVKRYFAMYRNAKKAADLAGVPRTTAHRWLKQDGLIEEDEGRSRAPSIPTRESDDVRGGTTKAKSHPVRVIARRSSSITVGREGGLQCVE